MTLVDSHISVVQTISRLFLSNAHVVFQKKKKVEVYVTIFAYRLSDRKIIW